MMKGPLIKYVDDEGTKIYEDVIKVKTILHPIFYSNKDFISKLTIKRTALQTLMFPPSYGDSEAVCVSGSYPSLEEAKQSLREVEALVKGFCLHLSQTVHKDRITTNRTNGIFCSVYVRNALTRQSKWNVRKLENKLSRWFNCKLLINVNERNNSALIRGGGEEACLIAGVFLVDWKEYIYDRLCGHIGEKFLMEMKSSEK